MASASPQSYRGGAETKMANYAVRSDWLPAYEALVRANTPLLRLSFTLMQETPNSDVCVYVFY